MEVEIKVRDLLKGIMNVEVDVNEIGMDDDLGEWGLNSTGVLELILNIEKQFGLEFGDEDFDAANFQSIGGLINYIERKLSSN